MTKPNQESIAAEHLSRQGFEPYCPRYLQRRSNKLPIIRPLFPRYLFVGIDQFWYAIRGTRGVSHILMGCEGPLPVNASIIKGLRDREEGGLVSLQPKARFAKGAAVKAIEGPFVGLPLLYEELSSHDRVRCLMDLLGRKVVIELEDKLLVAA